jgi:hypothetical protein
MVQRIDEWRCVPWDTHCISDYWRFQREIIFALPGKESIWSFAVYGCPVKQCVDKIHESICELFLHATGSVISKLPGQPGPVFYYAAVMKSVQPSDPPIRVVEFITKRSHSTSYSKLLVTIPICLAVAT